MTTQYLVRPQEARLGDDTNWHFKRDAYIQFKVGGKKIKSRMARHIDRNLVWSNESIVIPKTNDQRLTVDLKDKELFGAKTIASFDLNLQEIEDKKYVSQWFPLTKKGETFGQIFLTVELQVNGVSVHVPSKPDHQIVYEQKYDEYGYAIPGQIEPVMIDKEGVRSPVLINEDGSIAAPVKSPTTITNPNPITSTSTYVNKSDVGAVNPNLGTANPNLGTVNPNLGTANPNLGTSTSNKLQVSTTGTIGGNLLAANQPLGARLQPSEEVLTPLYIQEGGYRVPNFYEPASSTASKGKLHSVGVRQLKDDDNHHIYHSHEEYKVVNDGHNLGDQKIAVDRFVEIKATEGGVTGQNVHLPGEDAQRYVPYTNAESLNNIAGDQTHNPLATGTNQAGHA